MRQAHASTASTHAHPHQGSTRALACGFRRPRRKQGRPIHADHIPDSYFAPRISLRSARARSTTRGGACAPLLIALLLLISCTARAQLTWSLASGNDSWPADKRAAIVAAMTAAVDLYNANGYFPKNLWANYNAGVPTAQASYSGWIDFGGQIGTRTALHEISHTLGVGQYDTWPTNQSGGKWTGTYALNRVKLFDGAAATLNADTQHFWPYGLNQADEDGTTNRVRHIKMVSAMRRDMGIVSDSDGDGIPNDWEMFYFGDLSQTATGDADGDGTNNLAEYNADTNPANHNTRWTGTTSSDWTTATNWSPTTAPSNGTFFTRLNVNNAANNPLIYDATRGTTVLTPPDRGLVIGSGPYGSGTMTITGGSFSTVGATAPDVIGNSGNTGTLTLEGGSFASSELQLGVGGTGTGTLNLNGGTATITALNLDFGTGGSGTVHLNAATLTTGGIARTNTGIGTLNLNAGTLRASASSTTFLENLTNTFIKSGGVTIDTSTFNITIAQALKNDPASPNGGLTKSGTGSLTLSGPNTFTGPTAINAGTLEATNPSALGTTAAGVTVANAATLALANNIATPAAETVSIAGLGAGNRGSLQSASGSNTWNGPVTVAATGTRIGVQDDASLTISGNITESAPTTAVIFRAGLNSGNDIILSATGNSWTGITNLFSGNATGGAVKLAATNALPTATLFQVAGPGVHGRLDLNGFDQSAAGLTHSTSGSSAIGDGIITNSAATPSILTLDLPPSTTREFIGDILHGTGGIQLVKQGTGSQILSGNNNFSGATAINAGLLTAASDAALGHASGPTTVASGAALRLANGATITGETITLSGNGGSSTVGNFSGALQAAQTASATWAGPVILGDAAARIGAMPGGTLTVSGPLSGSGSFQSISIAAGTGGTATVILSAPAGASTYTGTTAIVRGTLKLGAANTLPVTTLLDIDSANAAEDAILDLNGHPQTAAALQRTNNSGGTGSAIVTNSHATPAILTLDQSATTTFNGRITGKLSLVKSGNGTLDLTGAANSYTGNTTVTAGTLSLATPFLADTSAVSISSGANLALNFPGTNTITALILNGLRMPTGTYTAANSGGRIAGTGSLIVTSAGTAGYAPWIDSFPGLTTDQKLPAADPDNDGSNNLAEFAFGGNPTSPTDNGQRQIRTTDSNGDSLPDLTLTLELRSGTTFTPDGPDLVSSIDGITYRIQGSTDLASFTSPVTQVTPHLGTGTAKSGYAFKTFRLAASDGLPDKGFLRASASLP